MVLRLPFERILTFQKCIEIFTEEMILLWKTVLHASEPKCSQKTVRDKEEPWVYCLARQAVAFRNLEADSEEGAVGFYSEIRDLAGFDRDCVRAASLVPYVSRVEPGS